MSLLRAYVVDDESLAVQRLTRLLEETGRVQVVGSTTDAEAALAFLQANDVDVLFLDIQMPELNGFELLERLERDPFVVFTTAYDHYAIDAFTVNSIDYLLKPVEPDRLARALDKLRSRRTSGRCRSARSRASSPRSSRRPAGSSVSRRASAIARRSSTSRASRMSSPGTS